MKVCLTLVLFGLVAVATSKHVHPPEYMVQIINTINRCKAEEHYSDEIIGIFMQKKMVPETKCLTACVTEKFGVLNADHTLNKDVALEGAKVFFGSDPVIIKKIDEAMTICSAEADSDRCESVYKIFTCLDQKRIEEGFEDPF